MMKKNKVTQFYSQNSSLDIINVFIPSGALASLRKEAKASDEACH